MTLTWRLAAMLAVSVFVGWIGIMTVIPMSTRVWASFSVLVLVQVAEAGLIIRRTTRWTPDGVAIIAVRLVFALVFGYLAARVAFGWIAPDPIRLALYALLVAAAVSEAVMLPWRVPGVVMPDPEPIDADGGE